MRLVADNRPSTPQPGYRESLSLGRCQRCHRTAAGVRTIGMRRQAELSWTRLALCPGCIEVGREQGYAVLS